MHIRRHHVLHELAGLFIDALGVDQDFADIRLEQVADGADYQTAFLVNQEGTILAARGFFYGLPQLQQVVQVPLQFFHAASDTGRARDQAHAGGHFQLGQHVTQFCALVAFHPAGYATTTGIVWHQHQITASQADETGQGCALVAALVLVNLDDDLLLFLQQAGDAGAAEFAVFALQIRFGDFLEGQKTMTVHAVIHKGGFQRRFYPGDNGLVNIAFALFPSCVLDVEINEFLTINDGNAQFFLMRCIEQHAFHAISPARHIAGLGMPG